MATKFENEKTELIVAGYIRNAYEQSISLDLVELILLFYDLVFHWRIRDPMLSNILSSKDDDEFESVSITEMDGVDIKYVIRNDDDEIGYGFNVDRIAKDIEYIIIAVQIHWIEIGFKTTIAARVSHDNTYHCSYDFHQLSEFKLFDIICIDCFAEIKYIKYKEESNKLCYGILPEMSKICTYQWQVEDNKNMTKTLTLVINP